MDIQCYLCLFQSISILYLIFVSPITCPSCWKSYILVGPWIHAFLTLLIFILIPIYTIIAVFINWDSVTSPLNQIGGFIVLQGTLSCVLIFWFAAHLVRHAIGVAVAVKERRNNKSETEKTKPYDECERYEGSG